MFSKYLKTLSILKKFLFINFVIFSKKQTYAKLAASGKHQRIKFPLFVEAQYGAVNLEYDSIFNSRATE